MYVFFPLFFSFHINKNYRLNYLFHQPNLVFHWLKDCVYYPHYPWQVHTFNKSTGAYEGMLYNNSYVINNNGGSGYLILDEPNNPGVSTRRGTWDTGDKSIIYYTNNHTEEFRLSAYVDFGSAGASFGTPVETDNSGRIIMFNPSELNSTQLENAKGSGANTSADNAGGTIDIFEKASGVKTMYSRGITTSNTSDYAAMGINTSNTQVHAGSKITTEDTNNRLYVKAL